MYIVPDVVERIGHSAFESNKAIVKISIGNGVKSIGKTSFAFCENLTDLVIPDNVTKIEDGAFLACTALKSVKIGKGLTEISAFCFLGVAIDELVIPSNVKVVNMGALYMCNIGSITMEEGVEKICEGAFLLCTNLKNIHIPSTVKEIEPGVFGDCTSLENVYFGGSEKQWKKVKIDTTNDEVLSNATIHFKSNLNSFVERMYTMVLGRNADLDGLNAWVQMLETGAFDGAGLAKEFVLGDEFAMRNLSDEEYVDVLYETFFDRAADETGKMLWMGELAAGKSRAYVLSKFVNLPEFTALCAEYDILRGVMFEDGNVATPGCVQFVGRLYDLVMGRDSDSEGLYTWTYALSNGLANAQGVATQFFNSAEYAAANKSNEAYVTDLYGVFMDRTPDESGLAFWVSCLAEQGVSRDWVLSEFAKSEEFKMIAARYGIQ